MPDTRGVEVKFSVRLVLTGVSGSEDELSGPSSLGLE
jgi:hypothetical protein